MYVIKIWLIIHINIKPISHLFFNPKFNQIYLSIDWLIICLALLRLDTFCLYWSFYKKSFVIFLSI